MALCIREEPFESSIGFPSFLYIIITGGFPIFVAVFLHNFPSYF